jgi:hypothetical protein
MGSADCILARSEAPSKIHLAFSMYYIYWPINSHAIHL